MDFKEADSKYFELKGRLEAGALTAEQFQALVGELSVQDDEGRYWTIDGRSGGWLFYDGANWVPGQPPAGVSPVVPPAPPQPPRRRISVALIGALAFALLLCVAALGGGFLILYGSVGGGPEEDETAAAIGQDEAESIADDIIAAQFPDLEGEERTTASYENPAGTEFWTITYRRDVEIQVGGETYTIPRVVIVSVDKDTGETEVAVSD